MFLGNDIVWLQDPHNRGKAAHQRFLDKVLTPAEQIWLRASALDKDAALWLLWSCKESAYKVGIKRGMPTFNNPKRLLAEVVRMEGGQYFAEVTGPCGRIYTRSTLTSDYVHTVASTHDFAGIRELIYPGAFRSDWGKLIATVAPGAEIEKDGRGIPALTGQSLDLSLSHDGHWHAAVWRSRRMAQPS